MWTAFRRLLVSRLIQLHFFSPQIYPIFNGGMCIRIGTCGWNTCLFRPDMTLRSWLGVKRKKEKKEGKKERQIEREKEKKKEKKRKKDKETDRQTDRQTERKKQTSKVTKKDKNRRIEKTARFRNAWNVSAKHYVAYLLSVINKSFTDHQQNKTKQNKRKENKKKSNGYFLHPLHNRTHFYQTTTKTTNRNVHKQINKRPPERI